MKNIQIKNLMYTRQFTSLSKKDVAIAGGKGASLGEMAQLGIMVPCGFVVLTNSFEDFLQENNLEKKIDLELGKVDIKKMETIEKASHKIQKLILTAKTPSNIEKEIRKKFAKLDAKFVAVRSSATVEDGNENAWAGQLDSFLNTTEKDLFKNIKKCWASLFTPRAIFYRFEKKLNKKNISVAVVIQKMIDSEKSGIAFSVHPVTQDDSQILIEAGFGLGEAIVSGAITPDAYTVNKKNNNIINVNINKQTKALFRKSSGGNEWKELREKGGKQILSEKEILELSEIVKKVENHYGVPQDIEWAFKNGKFFITQSRPITTLENKNLNQKNTRVLRNENMVKTNTENNESNITNTSKNKNILKREDYQHFMQHKGSVSFGSSFGLLWSTKDMEGLVLYSKNKRQTFISKKSMLKTLNEGNKLYSDKKFILKIKNELNDNFNKLRQETKKIENDGITKQKLINFLDYLDTLDKFYRYTDFFYTDKYFKTHKPSKKFIKDFENIKLTGRSYVNDAVYIKNSFTERLLKQISKKFNVAYQDISEYTTSEIFDLFHNKKPVENSILKKRRKAHVIYADEHEKVNILIGDEAIDFIKDFTKKESATVLKGQTASTGIAKGIARVIHVSVDDFDGIKKIRKETKKGEILVTDSTIPEIIEACKKVSAIVTNQGGMMSHAAIVSRELGIPCIVGVANATEIIKTGDFIEVDADKSIVRTIKT